MYKPLIKGCSLCNADVHLCMHSLVGQQRKDWQEAFSLVRCLVQAIDHHDHLGVGSSGLSVRSLQWLEQKPAQRKRLGGPCPDQQKVTENASS